MRIAEPENGEDRDVRSAGRAPVGPAVTRRELAALGLIVAAAALLRFAYLPSGSGFSVDQGTEMLALWDICATGRLPLYGPAAWGLGSTFHHGALYYYLIAPAACLSGSDPRAVVAEIVALNLTVIPMVWWIARSTGGRVAGLLAAVLVATSADFVVFSTFIWNPTFIVPGATLAFLGAFEALRTGRNAWWLAVAAGFAVAAQSHVAAGILVLPLGAAFLAQIVRTGAGRRLRVFGWGMAAAALVGLVYAPVVVNELLNGYPEVKGISAYLVSPPGYVSVSPPARLLFTAIRIPAWPLTGWPYFDVHSGFGLAALVSLAFFSALGAVAYRVLRLGRSISSGAVAPAVERLGVGFVGGSLVLLIVALGLGLRAVSELNASLSEQYHTAADPLVLIATGVALSTVWGLGKSRRARALGRTIVLAVLAATVAWNAAHWPPFVSPDGSWAGAQSTAERIERDAAGRTIGLVGLPGEIVVDAYRFPLIVDAAALDVPAAAGAIAIICDTRAEDECGGVAEAAWVAAHPEFALTLVDRWQSAPDRIVSVYRRV